MTLKSFFYPFSSQIFILHWIAALDLHSEGNNNIILKLLIQWMARVVTLKAPEMRNLSQGKGLFCV